MVKTKYTKAEVRKIVKELADALSAGRIVVDKIILYGSYANGNARDHSDIDLAVISPSFRGKSMLERQARLAAVLGKYLPIVEPVGYSTEDLENAESGTLLYQIKREGTVLIDRSQ